MRLRSLGLVALVVAFPACTSDSTDPAPVVASVSIASDSVTLGLQDQLQLSAMVLDGAGRPLARSVTWSTSDAAIAPVTLNGLVTGMARGVASIRAESEGKTDSLRVAVTFRYSGLTLGDFHGCDLRVPGAAHCWGDGRDGQVGHGGSGLVNVPTPVTGGRTFVALTGGRYHTCALTGTGEAFCWGNNATGQTGTGGTAQSQPTPMAVQTALRFSSISASGFHTCAVTAAGVGYCWGSNDFGQLGNNSTAEQHAPVPIAGGLLFTAVSPGRFHTCALTMTGDAYCWGLGLSGELGNNARASDSVPRLVAGGRTYASINSGYGTTCAVTGAGVAYCWGVNEYGELGHGMATSADSTPQPVAGGLTFLTIDAAQSLACGLAADSTAYCWGHNLSGGVGDSTSSDRNVPTRVAGGLRFREIRAGTDKGCGIATDGRVFCWGYNGQGALGTGTFDSANYPMPVTGQQ